MHKTLDTNCSHMKKREWARTTSLEGAIDESGQNRASVYLSVLDAAMGSGSKATGYWSGFFMLGWTKDKGT